MLVCYGRGGVKQLKIRGHGIHFSHFRHLLSATSTEAGAVSVQAPDSGLQSRRES